MPHLTHLQSGYILQATIGLDWILQLLFELLVENSYVRMIKKPLTRKSTSKWIEDICDKGNKNVGVKC